MATVRTRSKPPSRSYTVLRTKQAGCTYGMRMGSSHSGRLRQMAQGLFPRAYTFGHSPAQFRRRDCRALHSLRSAQLVWYQSSLLRRNTTSPVHCLSAMFQAALMPRTSPCSATSMEYPARVADPVGTIVDKVARVVGRSAINEDAPWVIRTTKNRVDILDNRRAGNRRCSAITLYVMSGVLVEFILSL